MGVRKIEERVHKILQEYKVQRPPVPVEAIARRLGAEIRYSPFEGDISGMVYRDKDRTVIGVNSLHHMNRQRFTIAHEIGHMLLHEGTEVHVDKTFRVNLRDDLSSQAVDREEMEANGFAAELLMPRHMLLEDLKGREIDFENEENIRRLASKYRVSPQAVTFRLMNLGVVSLD
jgi:Zn-dependent peptidase ImmA (M78 family)